MVRLKIRQEKEKTATDANGKPKEKRIDCCMNIAWPVKKLSNIV